MPSYSAKTRLVVILAFPGVKLLDVAGPLQVFADARTNDGLPGYDVRLASIDRGFVETDTRIALPTARLRDIGRLKIDTLLIAGGGGVVDAAASPAFRRSVIAQARRVRRLGSVCVGAFVLAQCGLLDGHEATTHWQDCDRLAAKFPAISVRPDAIFVRSGDIWTSAGVAAGIDLALALVEDDLGRDVALGLARELVLFLKRPGGQAQFSVDLQRQLRDTARRFDALHDHMRANLTGDLSVPALARAAGMSARHFARVYGRETGESPARAVEAFRADAARRLLETTPLPVQRVAALAGFGDDERMRRSFVRRFGIAPADYRAYFGG